jgi:hypothetical protein
MQSLRGTPKVILSTSSEDFGIEINFLQYRPSECILTSQTKLWLGQKNGASTQKSF